VGFDGVCVTTFSAVLFRVTRNQHDHAHEGEEEEGDDHGHEGEGDDHGHEEEGAGQEVCPEGGCVCAHTKSQRELASSLVPRLSWNVNMYRAESLVSFLRRHDIIKIGPEQKGNVLRNVQPTMLQRSGCMLFNVR